MPDTTPPTHHPAEQKQSEPASSQPAGSSAESNGTDLLGKLKIVGGLITAVAALLTALNGADWLQKAEPTPSPQAQGAGVATLPAAPTPSTAPTAFTPSPSPTPAAQAPEGTLLIEDFSDPSSGWETETSEEYEFAYVDGEYRIAVHLPDLTVWGGPPGAYEFSDFTFEVDSRYVSGPDDGDYGLVVRSTGDASFYLLAVNTQFRSYSVQICQDESWDQLVEWTDSEALGAGKETNHLRVECLGPTMRFYANGQLLTEVVDRTFSSGGIGLLADTFEEGGVEVHFDNVRVQVLKGF